MPKGNLSTFSSERNRWSRTIHHHRCCIQSGCYCGFAHLMLNGLYTWIQCMSEDRGCPIQNVKPHKADLLYVHHVNFVHVDQWSRAPLGSAATVLCTPLSSLCQDFTVRRQRAVRLWVIPVLWVYKKTHHDRRYVMRISIRKIQLIVLCILQITFSLLKLNSVQQHGNDDLICLLLIMQFDIHLA